jgi:hypothetical protein
MIAALGYTGAKLDDHIDVSWFRRHSPFLESVNWFGVLPVPPLDGPLDGQSPHHGDDLSLLASAGTDLPCGSRAPGADGGDFTSPMRARRKLATVFSEISKPSLSSSPRSCVLPDCHSLLRSSGSERGFHWGFSVSPSAGIHLKRSFFSGVLRAPCRTWRIRTRSPKMA